MKDEKVELEARRNKMYGKAKEACEAANLARKKWKVLNNTFERINKEYRELDRELAMMNITTLPPSGADKMSKSSSPELTITQIKEIANKLGIKVTIKED